MSLRRSIFLLAAKRQYAGFVAACEQPDKPQEELWTQTRQLIAGSAFWRDRTPGLGTKQLAAMPITTYEHYRAPLEASFSGTTCPFTGQTVMFWCSSSGTSDRRKLFPLTPAFRQQFQRIMLPFLGSVQRRFTNFAREKILYFAALDPTERSPAGLEVGFISNFNYHRLPGLVRSLYAFPPQVFRGGELFQRWGSVYALSSDLSGIFSITPSVLQRFMTNADASLDLLQAALAGRASIPPGLPPLKISAARKRHIMSLKSGTPLTMKHLWPTLDFVSCWMSAACGMQLKGLASYTDGLPVIDAPYSATEGWLTVPIDALGPGGALHPNAHIVEFFPAEIDDPKPSDLLKPWELKVGRDYEVVLTTAMGMVRYRLYDVVRCVGFFHRTPRLEFLHKAGNIINLGQAKLREADLVKAAGLAGIVVNESYLFAPSATGDQLFLYCAAKPGPSPEQIAKLDQHLQTINPEYAKDIVGKLCKPIAVIQVPADKRPWDEPLHGQSKPKILAKTPLVLPAGGG